MGLGFRVSGLRLKALGIGLMGLGCRVYLGVVGSELSLLHRWTQESSLGGSGDAVNRL